MPVAGQSLQRHRPPTCSAHSAPPNHLGLPVFTVYVLQSASTSRLYIGQTGDLQRRLQEHREGLARYTRNRGPWVLVHHEELATRSEAVRRERFLKSGQGRDWLKDLINRNSVPPPAD